MVIFLLALIGTAVIMAILTVGRLFFGRREKFEQRAFWKWFIGYTIFNYIFCLVSLYFSHPALTGPFGGWQWLLWPLAISSIGNLFAFAGPAMGVLEDLNTASQGGGLRSRTTRNAMPANVSRGAIAAGILGLVVAGVVGILAPLLITVFTTWFDVNAKALAAIPNVRMQKTQTLPPTDVKHIVLVSKSVASYKGQQILGSSGENLGSAYRINPESYTLQSINKRLYYVAPLVYNNIFVNLSSSTTPGFVVVDAEDPQAAPRLFTEQTQKGASLGYIPGALLNQDLLRHVYLNGYTYGRLLDPTLELDDNYRPYWTVSVMQPIRGYVGDSLAEVLVVDAHSGAITKYTPGNVPEWVDRVLPASTVEEYLEWWGLYHDAPWFNPSGLGKQKPASEPQLLYNIVDQPVWMVPMTSASANDNSSTGFFLFNTHKNEADFYPLAGIGIGDNVERTLQSTRANIRGYDVASIQLYQIYNVPTWVAIYVQNTRSGDIFQAVGLVDARNLNGANVQFEPGLAQALQSYQQWLTQQGGSGTTATDESATKTVNGKVLRVSSVQQGTSTIYYLQIEGQDAIFTANLSLSPELPLVQPGDIIKGDYQDTGGTVINFKTFDDLSINLGGTGASGTPTPTPTAIPTATPTATSP